MITVADLVDIVVRNSPNLKKNRVVFIIKEYIIVVSKELLKGNKVEFPNEFGTAEVVKKKMNPDKLKALIREKKEIIDYFYDTKVQYDIPALKEYYLNPITARSFNAKIEYVLKNKLKVYRHVN